MDDDGFADPLWADCLTLFGPDLDPTIVTFPPSLMPAAGVHSAARPLEATGCPAPEPCPTSFPEAPPVPASAPLPGQPSSSGDPGAPAPTLADLIGNSYREYLPKKQRACTAEEEQQRVMDQRSKNRLRAKQCRDKKNGQWEDMVAQLHALSGRNQELHRHCAYLTETNRLLMEENRRLRHALEAHAGPLGPHPRPPRHPQGPGPGPTGLLVPCAPTTPPSGSAEGSASPHHVELFAAVPSPPSPLEDTDRVPQAAESELFQPEIYSGLLV